MTDDYGLALCTETGCPAFKRIDTRHVRNFEGRWRCPNHDHEENIHARN